MYNGLCTCLPAVHNKGQLSRPERHMQHQQIQSLFCNTQFGQFRLGLLLENRTELNRKWN